MRYLIPVLASVAVAATWVFATTSSSADMLVAQAETTPHAHDHTHDTNPLPAPTAAVPSPSREELLQLRDSDFYLGNKDAKVAVIEYSSLSCPHCAEFHNTVFPKLSEEYINPGKVLFIHRDFPLNGPALKAALLAQCSREQYFTFLKVLFSTQSKWAFSQDFMKVLEVTAKLGGISKEKFDGCMSDKKLEQHVLQTRKDAAEVLKVQSTPTFFVNGEEVKGVNGYDAFKTIVDKHLK